MNLTYYYFDHHQQIKIGYDVKENAKAISFEINKAGWYKVEVLR